MDAAQRGEVLAAAMRVLDAETFNRLVASIPDTRVKGRLRFWQEDLLARVSAEIGYPLTTTEGFLAVFENAELRPILEQPRRQFSKEEFLSDPVGVYLDPSIRSIPAEWFREAWDVEEADPEKSLRKYLTGDICHETNKGALPLIAGQLQSLASVLRIDQWLRLYQEIRDEDPHREEEVRQAFVRAAPQLALSLPPLLTRDEVVRLLGSEELAQGLLEIDEQVNEREELG